MWLFSRRARADRRAVPTPGRPSLRDFVRDHLVPVAVTVLFVELEHAQWISLVPVVPALALEYGRGGLLLALTAAFVTSATFTKGDRQFGVLPFLLTVMVASVLLLPIVSVPQGYPLGLRPPAFRIILVFAYLGLHVAAGIFIAGLWTAMVRAFYRDEERRQPGKTVPAGQKTA